MKFTLIAAAVLLIALLVVAYVMNKDTTPRQAPGASTPSSQYNFKTNP